MPYKTPYYYLTWCSMKLIHFGLKTFNRYLVCTFEKMLQEMTLYDWNSKTKKVFFFQSNCAPVSHKTCCDTQTVMNIDKR